MSSHKSESEKAKSQDEMKDKEESNQSGMDDNDDAGGRKWQWAPPLIEGVPPSPRGGHTATKTGGCIVIFGVREV